MINNIMKVSSVNHLKQSQNINSSNCINKLREQMNPSKNINHQTAIQLSIMTKPPKDFRDISYNNNQLM